MFIGIMGIKAPVFCKIKLVLIVSVLVLGAQCHLNHPKDDNLFLFMVKHSGDFDLCPRQKNFSYVRTGLPGLNQYKAEDKVSCSRTQRSTYSEV